MEFLHNLWDVFLELSPWLLLGMLFAGVMHILVPRNFVSKHLGGKGVATIFKAVFLGVPLPLCSCGVIPAAIGLKRQGAGNGASIAFLISTPQTGVDSIMVSAGLLGWPFALFKVLAAFVTGILGGGIVQAVDPGETVSEDGVSEDAKPSGNILISLYDFSVNELLKSFWIWLLGGMVLSALISRFLDPGALKDIEFMQYGILAMLLMLVISLPMYVCATSSVPIAAALVEAGLPAGAALVFLMAGPASNVATVGAIYKAFGGKVLTIYLTVIAVFSCVFGYVFSFVLEVQEVSLTGHNHAAWYETVAAVLLILLFIKFAISDIRTRLQSSGPKGQDNLQLMVTGMTCGNCSNKVKSGLLSVDGVSGVEVDLKSGRVDVNGTNLEVQTLSDAVKKLGFGVTKSEAAEACCKTGCCG